MLESFKECAVHVEDEDAIQNLEVGLRKCLKRWRKYSDIVFVCIGTDRSSGDSLGPMVGTFLNEQKLNIVKVHGTLEEPVHGMNLENALEEINSKYEKPLVIGVDACLGSIKSVGKIKLFKGSIEPGAGVGKKLPKVGKYGISAVVNVSGFMELFVLQNTRLNLVMKMAKTITNSIIDVDKRLNENEKRRQKRLKRA